MIEIQSVDKAFGNVPIFKHFSQTLSSSRLCITAPNGTGKSTLLAMLSGLLPFDQGDILVDGESVKTSYEHIGLCSDTMLFPDFLTATDIFRLTQQCHHCLWPQDLIDGFQLQPHLHKTIAILSAGNLKKVHLINGMMRNPKVLLVDEPNVALDKHSVSFMWQLFKAFEGTIIATSNEPNLFVEHGFTITPMEPTGL